MLLASFWVLQLIVSIVIVRSHLLHYFEMVRSELVVFKMKLSSYIFKNYFRDQFQFILSLIELSIIASNFVLALFSEQSKIQTKQSDSKMKIYPENFVSLLSKLSFWWINP